MKSTDTIINAIFGEEMPTSPDPLAFWDWIDLTFKSIHETTRPRSALHGNYAEMLSLRFRYHKTLQQIGDHFGVTRERVRQHEAKALRRLSRPPHVKWVLEHLKTAP
jgi:RNA polymerase primary sigma factor